MCVTLILDGSLGGTVGLANRPVSYYWGVTPALNSSGPTPSENPFVSLPGNYTFLSNSSRIALPSDSLPNYSTLRFALLIRNFMGYWSLVGTHSVCCDRALDLVILVAPSTV